MSPQLSDLDIRVEKIIILLENILECIVTDYTALLNSIKEDCDYLTNLNSINLNTERMSQVENQLTNISSDSNLLRQNVVDIKDICSNLQQIVSDIKTLMPSGGGSTYNLDELMNFNLSSASSSNSLARQIQDIASNVFSINSYIRFGNKDYVYFTRQCSISSYDEVDFTPMDIKSFSLYITKWTNNSGQVGTLQIGQFAGLVGTYTEEQMKCLNGVVFNINSSDSKITFTSVDAIIEILMVAYK